MHIYCNNVMLCIAHKHYSAVFHLLCDPSFIELHPSAALNVKDRRLFGADFFSFQVPVGSLGLIVMWG